MDSNLLKTKSIEQLVGDVEHGGKSLRRTLTALDLTLLGIGEIFAWMIGWDLILEYAVGSMTVAVGWSGYFQRILAGFGIHLPAWMAAAPAAAPGSVINLPAMIIVLFIMVLLVIGIRES